MKQLLKFDRSHLLVISAWVLLWMIPLGKLPSIQSNVFLAILTDMMRLGIALLVFIVPGALLYIFWRQVEKPGINLLELIPIGFTFQHF